MLSLNVVTSVKLRYSENGYNIPELSEHFLPIIKQRVSNN